MLGDMLIVRTHTVRITLNERLRDVHRRFPSSTGSGWSVVIQFELRKWVLVLVLLIVVGGRRDDRRRQTACTPWVVCRGERTGSRREISGFVLHGNYKYFISEKNKTVV
jgi:hypothetical protein